MMNEDVSKANSTATYYLPNCEILRIHAGMTKTALAKAANVSRDTISTIEKKHPVTAAMINLVYNALAAKNRDVGFRAG
ncbi:MAG: helix-turn-helix domain-containing protein [Gammaproteobacteria bacterium]